ncbi:glycosyltransferase family 4 protein [Dyella sp. LX-66]|uniref:glycosyltransferase family 4 protein n=1 Tax=unclassified Dyella TaxID=2634549 RepID=UPI001BE01FDB|nr:MULTISPECIES: glycosyltransferase family 4 protein [unclassified Dyella]MBT2118302.1 glycosyltransferase family 4 protein [Dyella sp. LX-1]MBT2140185.1 glycosyltransferase family 4 protein [Dyella sp. LX-66]
MKLALVLPGGVDRGGEERVIPAFLALIGQLAQRHEVHVFVLRQEPKPGTWMLRGATVHNIGDGRQRSRAIAAILAEHRRGPFDAVQAIFSGTCSLVAVAAAKLIRRPGLVHIAGGELIALPAIRYGGRQRWVSRLREAVTLRAAAAVTAASAPILASLQALGIDAQRLPLGVDLAAWPPLPPRRRASGPARLLHVASLNRVKDQPTLLRALAALAAQGVAFQLDIVGVDTLDGEMQRLRHALDLDAQVRFLGFKTQRELRPLMEAAELLVMSSLHEAGPLVLLEAAVAGVPTVGTAVGHLAEWSPVAALAVPVGDHLELARAVRQVLEDEELRLRLAHEAQRRAVDEDAVYTAARFEALYRNLSRHAA